MRVVIGLGNPGTRYQDTRHNVGFMVLDAFAAAESQRLGLAMRWQTRFKGLLCLGSSRPNPASRADTERFALFKPQNYVNLSGEAVVPLLRYYRVPAEETLVLVDDLDLPLGALRMRTSGSDGGHRGLRSIIQVLGSQNFKRLRIGVGRPAQDRSVNQHVLSAFTPAETRFLQPTLTLAQQKMDAFLCSGRFENWSRSITPADLNPPARERH